MKIDYVSERTIKDQVLILHPGDLFPLLKRYSRTKQEKFIVITLDGAHQVLRVKMISLGLVNRTIVHPREVFRPAILDSAAAIIIAHNHPSNKLEPSSGDDEITDRLVKAGEIIGIPVLDHIVFGNKEWYSYQKQGRMPL